MQLYAILRRDGFADEPDLQAAAARAALPIDEIIAIADTVVVRPDPAPATV